MPVEDRPAKGCAFHGIAVTSDGAMTPSQHKLEGPAARLSEESDRIVPESARIFLDVIEDLVHKFWIVQSAKDFLDHRLLIRRKGLPDLCRRDLPVGVHFGAQRMIKWECHCFPLFR